MGGHGRTLHLFGLIIKGVNKVHHIYAILTKSATNRWRSARAASRNFQF
jgi:hypothetical protein